MNKTTATAKTIAERAAVEPTELHRHFAEWIEAETGIKPDLKTVQLAVIFRMDFQASPENQAVLAAKKAAAAATKKASAARKKAKLEAELAKLTGKVAATEEYDSEADQALSDDEAEVKAAVAEQEIDTTPVKLTLVYGGMGEPEVHAFGCADLKKKTRKQGYSKETLMAHSHTEITAHIYSPEEFGEDSVKENYMAYNTLPCAGRLND